MSKIKATENISKNYEKIWKHFERHKNAMKKNETEKSREPSESTDWTTSEPRSPSDCTGTVWSISSWEPPRLGSARKRKCTKVTPCVGSTFTTRPNNWEIVAEASQNSQTYGTHVGSSKNKEFVTYL